jgi:ribosome-associated translation inhibitor RaiA
VSAKLMLSILTACLLLCPACDVEQTGGSPINPGDSATEAIRHERQMYQNRVQANLNDLERRIAALKARLRNHERGAEKRDQLISGLDRKRAGAFQKLEGLKTSSHEAWGDMKAGIDSAMDELEIAYQQANSHFK